MHIQNDFTTANTVRLPVIMAPMFLVSNKALMLAAVRNGLMGVFPTLNFREKGALKQVLVELNEFRRTHEQLKGSYGVNLIVQKTNPLYEEHLKICVEQQVPFYITSLGNPAKVIELAHSYGAKVYCDVTNINHAKKCYELNCDGFIAVGQGAGGHAGPNPLHLLIPSLKKNFPDKPVVAAGGIATGEGMLSMLALGASAVSIGTRFIASEEATVSDAYKNAIVDSGMDDIVLTEKLSGTPCNIINTSFAKKIGYRQNWFERFLSTNPRTKKYFKMLVQVRGMRKLEKAVRPGSYHTLWSAGQSVEMIEKILSVDEIVSKLETEFDEALTKAKGWQ